MTPFLAFTVAAAITYALRASMTIAGSRITRSEHLGSVVALATPAVLAAMIAASTAHGEIGRPVPVEVAATALAFVVARRTGNLGLGVAVGIPAYWLGAIVGLA